MRSEQRAPGLEVGNRELTVAPGTVTKMAQSGSSLPAFIVWVLLLCETPGIQGLWRHVRTITDKNWKELLEGEWMIEFYAPWCPACQNLQPEWEDFAEWGEDLEVNIAKVDVTEQPGLSGRFIITALPTIYHCRDGEFRRYQGPRTKKDFISFINDKEWKNIEPISSWFGPGSFLMSSMSALFQLSMWIRTCHNYFTEDLKIPVWGSYAIFALATLFSGLILGLIMVFVADFLCPSKTNKPLQYPYSKKLPPESSHLLKKLEQKQEEDEEDHSDDESENKNPSKKGFSQTAMRQRIVSPLSVVDKS
ncbi:thioredoxin-related transmembrane protein 1 isoform X3 [Phascolarctos cinereus]|uniref:Thioredoxin-related transmembrane protein 1 n=1 Tax=Phascolarctos cinereus TaxID=38626 RepID=A0A6P5JNN4_PHACI|nr:thioredoxin-related transmembrane protein 1 [Phascolarctos cinereus]